MKNKLGYTLVEMVVVSCVSSTLIFSSVNTSIFGISDAKNLMMDTLIHKAVISVENFKIVYNGSLPDNISVAGDNYIHMELQGESTEQLLSSEDGYEVELEQTTCGDHSDGYIINVSSDEDKRTFNSCNDYTLGR